MILRRRRRLLRAGSGRGVERRVEDALGGWRCLLGSSAFDGLYKRFPSDQVIRYPFLRLAPENVSRNDLNYNNVNHDNFSNSQWHVSRSVMSPDCALLSTTALPNVATGEQVYFFFVASSTQITGLRSRGVQKASVITDTESTFRVYRR
jgi:hypothetical protein